MVLTFSWVQLHIYNKHTYTQSIHSSSSPGLRVFLSFFFFFNSLPLRSSCEFSPVSCAFDTHDFQQKKRYSSNSPTGFFPNALQVFSLLFKHVSSRGLMFSMLSPFRVTMLHSTCQSHEIRDHWADMSDKCNVTEPRGSTDLPSLSGGPTTYGSSCVVIASRLGS